MANSNSSFETIAHKYQDRLRFFKVLVSRYNHYLAKTHLTVFPQIAIFSFDHIGLAINSEGRYENAPLILVRKLILANFKHLQNGTVLDIGANIGNHAIFFADLFTDVYAYEPNPRTFALLEFNAKFSTTARNINCRNYGLSDTESSLLFRVSSKNIGGSSIIKENSESDDAYQIYVDVRKADQIAEICSKKISLIKVDVEGHELQALTGAEYLIKRDRPLILFEQHISEIINGSSPVIEYLRNLNYKFFTIEKNFYLGENVFFKFVTLFLPGLFGTQIKIARTDNFKNRFYEMIIAVPK